MRLSRRSVDYLALVGMALLLLVGSVVDVARVAPALARALRGKDLLVHALLYGCLAILWCRLLRGTPGWRFRALVAAVLSAGYGVALEVLQSSLPFRTCSLADMGSSTLGSAAGAALWAVAAFRRSVASAGALFRTPRGGLGGDSVEGVCEEGR